MDAGTASLTKITITERSAFASILVYYWLLFFGQGHSRGVKTSYAHHYCFCQTGRFPMVCGAYAHLHDLLGSKYQSFVWTQHTTCE